MINRTVAEWQSNEHNTQYHKRASNWPEVAAQELNYMKSIVIRKAGFTLVEIMIVVAIIGLLAAIAVPAFAKNRSFSRRSICMANLKQLENAKTVWAQENRKGNS